jgi:hypothetical protein
MEEISNNLLRSAELEETIKRIDSCESLIEYNIGEELLDITLVPTRVTIRYELKKDITL